MSLAFLLAFALCLPHSIAAAQLMAALAGTVWLAGLMVERRRPPAIPLSVPLLLFVGVTVLSSVFSLEPALSLTKLKSVLLILLAPLVADTVRNKRQAGLLLGLLLGSAAVGASATVWEKMVGSGVEVLTLAPGSPFERAGVLERDVIVACDDQRIRGSAYFGQLLAQHDSSAPLACRGYRAATEPYEFTVRPEQQPPGQEWGVRVRTARTIRARGSYGHWTTYAEVLVQLTALAFGLWLARRDKWRWWPGGGLLLLCLLLTGALAATFTRASWAALLAAVLVMVWIRLGLRGRIAAILLGILLLVGMNEGLERWRGVGFYNPSDLSMQYRRLMWEDGLRLIGEHPLLGVGMDSVKTRWRELGLRAYEQLGLHSHFHSTPIQLAVERGLLGLATWLFLMVAYLRLLVRWVRQSESQSWLLRGTALGILGSLCGFLTSGFLHYNLGDSEVAMVVWLLMGVAVSLPRLTPSRPAMEAERNLVEQESPGA